MSDSYNEKHEGLAVSRKRTSVELDAMRRLHELSTLSITEGDIEAILCEIVDTAMALTGADFGNIYLIDPGSSVFRLAAQRGFPQWWVDFWNNAPLGRGSCGVALERGERVIVENVEQSSMFAGAPLEMQLKAGVRAVQSTPLLSRSGKPLGVFSTQYRKPHRPDEDKLRLLDLLARQSADIIEHVQSVAMLRRQAALFRLSFDAILVWRVEGGIESWSRGAETLYGFTESEAIDHTPQDLLKTVLPVSPSEIETVLKDRGNWEGELRHRTKDGREVIVSSRLQWIRGDDGGIRILEICRDITDRKRAEDALRAVSAELRHTLEIAGIGLSRCSCDLRYLSVNPAYAQWIGLTEDEIVGRRIVDVMGEKAFEVIRPRIERVLRGERVEYDDELPLAAGRKCIRVIYTPDEDACGNVVGWVASVMDITRHKQVEEAARRQASLLRHSFDAIFVWRIEGGIESWSRGAETLYGFAEHEAIGKRPQDLLKTVFPVSLSETERILKDRGNWEGELRHRTKDGREIVVSARLQLIPGGNGTASILEINRDITERKRMEEERAEEGRRKDEFLSLLGHELRNPLAAISTAVQLLSGSASDSERASLKRMMERQVKLMQRLLDDLIDLGRITHGQIQLKKGPIDLAKFLKHVTKVTHSITAKCGQEMILRLPSEVVTFKADEARLEQIATNLLNNASKYTPRGGRIEFSGAREGSEVVIRCKDSGRGIPREMHQAIFQPFTRVEPFSDSRGEASLGIGLALVKQLVELHGGTISVESGGSGMGSEFVVRLPLESAPSGGRAAAREPKPAPGLSRSIVLIEDNSDLAAAMVLALEKAGYRVTLFEDAFSTLAGISDLKPHAILLDIGLPGMDGYELAARLRKEQHLRHTSFIGISGFKRREAAESANNFDHFFNKPVDLPALLSFLDTSMDSGF